MDDAGRGIQSPELLAHGFVDVCVIVNGGVPTESTDEPSFFMSVVKLI
jgi:hypothetical protein